MINSFTDIKDKDEATFSGLLGGSTSGDDDSDVDRPPLTEADRRRRENKQRSKVKPKPTLDQIEEYKRINEQKKRDCEDRKKNKKRPRGDRDERKQQAKQAREGGRGQKEKRMNVAESKRQQMMQEKEQIISILK